MAFTYNSSSAVGQVRLLIADTVDSGHIFEDAEIEAFLDMADDSTNRAAAKALRAIAASHSRLAARLKVLDVEVDYTKAAAELRALAKEFDQADEDEGGFAIAAMVNGVMARREKLIADLEAAE